MNAPAKIGRGKFSGDLSAFSIFEVCQFLMIVRHTGTVSIKSESRNGTITISEGQIVSVVDDSLKEGEDAFYNIVTWKNGTFEYAPGPVAIGATPKIPMSTDGLLLEAARKLDEGEIGDGQDLVDSGGTHAGAIIRNQQFADEFADLLTSLDGQYDDEIDFQKDVSLEKILALAVRRKANQIYLQVGSSPKARVPEGMVNIGRSAVTQRALDRICRRFFDELPKRGATETDSQLSGERVLDKFGHVRLELERSTSVDRVLIRCLQSESLPIDQFGVSNDGVLNLLGARRGIFLVGSPPRGGKSALAASLAGAVAARTHRHVVLHQESPRYHLDAAHGYLENRDLLGSTNDPTVISEMVWRRKVDVVVLDAIRHPAQVEGALQASANGAVVVAAVEAYDVPDAVLNFISLSGKDDLSQTAGRLAQAILGILVLTSQAQPATSHPERKGEIDGPRFESQFLPRVPGLPEAVRDADMRAIQGFLLNPDSPSERAA